MVLGANSINLKQQKWINKVKQSDYYGWASPSGVAPFLGFLFS